MKILVTGAWGFIGRNLTESLKNIRDGKDKTRRLKIEDVYEFGSQSDASLLEEYCRKADFVFHLAGVNRPESTADFMRVNRDFTKQLLSALAHCGNACPVMLASSVQAALDNEYGKSKREAEALLVSHAASCGAKALVYRLPNVFGKWCKPNYNSVVATFCHNTAHGLPISIHDKAKELELVYIDDLVAELLDALEGKDHKSADGKYCTVPTVHRKNLGKIADLLADFAKQPATLLMPQIPAGSFEKKLYSTYVSFLPKEKAVFSLKTNSDARGSFTELLKTDGCGQFSVNITKPGVTKGEHWHHSKWELFVVVAGKALVRQRKIGSDEVLDFVLSGDDIRVVHMLPGYTHSITNLSKTENLVTLMWANESFDADKPDTFFEIV